MKDWLQESKLMYIVPAQYINLKNGVGNRPKIIKEINTHESWRLHPTRLHAMTHLQLLTPLKMNCSRNVCIMQPLS